jgi:hypothetical protein
MNKKNEENLKALGDAYKDLPLKMRVRVNITVAKLLAIQKKNSAFLNNVGDLLLDDGRGDGK